MSDAPDTTTMYLQVKAEEFANILAAEMPEHKFHVALMSAGAEGTRSATNKLSAPLSVVWSWAEQLVVFGNKLKKQIKDIKRKKTN